MASSNGWSYALMQLRPLIFIFIILASFLLTVNATAEQEHDYQVDFNASAVRLSDFRTTITIKVQALVAVNTSSPSLITDEAEEENKKNKKAWFNKRLMYSSEKYGGKSSSYNNYKSLDQDMCDEIIYVTGECPSGTPYTMMTFTVPINVYATVKPQVDAYLATMLDDSIILCAYIDGPESFGYNACNALNTCAGKFEVNGYILPAKEYRSNKKACRQAKKLCDEQVKFLQLTNDQIGKGYF